MTRRIATEEKKKFLNSHDISQILEDTLAQFDFEHVHWLESEDYAKAKTQLRMNVAGIFDFMKVDDKLPIRYMYGLGDFVQGAIEEATRLAEDFGLRVRGIDKAINLEIIRRKSVLNIESGKENK